MGFTEITNMEHPEVVARDEARNGNGPIELGKMVFFDVGDKFVFGDEIYSSAELDNMELYYAPEIKQAEKPCPYVEEFKREMAKITLQRAKAG